MRELKNLNPLELIELKISRFERVLSELNNELSKMRKEIRQINLKGINIFNKNQFDLFVCEIEKTTNCNFREKSRKGIAPMIRHILAYLIYVNYGNQLKLKDIGKLTSYSIKDHATIIHSINKTKDMLSIGDFEFCQQYNLISNIFNKYLNNEN